MAENVAIVCDVTGVTAEQATKLLEMSNGNVDAAIGLFFETGVGGLQQQNEPVEQSIRREPEPVRKTIDPIISENPEEKFEVSAEDIMKKAVEQGAKSIGEVGEQKKRKPLLVLHIKLVNLVKLLKKLLWNPRWISEESSLFIKIVSLLMMDLQESLMILPISNFWNQLKRVFAHRSLCLDTVGKSM
jgi:hypothetical protein